MSKFSTLARLLLEIEDDLPNRFDYTKDKKIYDNTYDIHIFDQLWGSTALGFGGIGGQAMTTATTVVLVPFDSNQDHALVYFAGRYAYKCKMNKAFKEDLKSHNMASVCESMKYNRPD